MFARRGASVSALYFRRPSTTCPGCGAPNTLLLLLRRAGVNPLPDTDDLLATLSRNPAGNTTTTTTTTYTMITRSLLRREKGRRGSNTLRRSEALQHAQHSVPRLAGLARNGGEPAGAHVKRHHALVLHLLQHSVRDVPLLGAEAACH